MLLAESAMMSVTAPRGNPLPNAPEICVHVPPLSALRYKPLLLTVPASTTCCPAMLSAVGTTVWMLRPLNVLVPSCAQVSPPSAVRSTPVRDPPSPRPLLNRPTPAKSVLLVASSGLNSMSPIDSDGNWSVNGVQFGLAAVALLVRQTPPSTVAMNTRAALAGSTAIASTAPACGLSV